MIISGVYEKFDGDNCIYYMVSVRKLARKYRELGQDNGYEVGFVTDKNGRLLLEDKISLYEYIEQYSVICDLTEDMEIVRNIKTFLRDYGAYLPYSDDYGQLEYYDIAKEIMDSIKNERQFINLNKNLLSFNDCY